MLCDKMWGFVKRNSTVPGVVIVFAAAYVFMLAVHAGGDGAAWIQAIGSVGAIIAATYIAHEDRRADQRRERKKHAVVCAAALLKIDAAKSKLADIHRYLSHELSQHARKEYASFIISTLSESIRDLRTIDLASMPDPRVLNALVMAIESLERAKGDTSCRGFLEGYGGPYSGHIFWMDEAIDVFSAYIVQLGES